jgi:hypothetical protein
MKWEQLSKLGQKLPEVIEDTWYGTPALKVKGKGFVRLRPEGDAVVFLLQSLEEQEFLIESQPDVYYITDHYTGWPTVLARLAALREPEARLRLDRAWRAKAPAALLRRAEGADAPGPTVKAKPKSAAKAKVKAKVKPKARPAPASARRPKPARSR